MLSDDDPDRESKLAKHVDEFPEDNVALIDSASSFGGKKRELPTRQQAFIPVGSIALAIADPEPEIQEPQESIFMIASFYISRALQHGGLGRAALDTLESMAAGEPLCAKVLTLNTVAREHSIDLDRRGALGIPVPKVRKMSFMEFRITEVESRL